MFLPMLCYALMIPTLPSITPLFVKGNNLKPRRLKCKKKKGGYNFACGSVWV
jgi:hypothetical protein